MAGGDGELGPAESAKPPRTTLARELWWAGLVIALAVFMAAGRVSTYLGSEGRGRANVWDVWRHLAGSLPGGDSGAVRAGYVLVLLLFAGGSLSALWFALAADGSDEAPEDEHVVEAAVRPTSALPLPETP